MTEKNEENIRINMIINKFRFVGHNHSKSHKYLKLNKDITRQ